MTRAGLTPIGFPRASTRGSKGAERRSVRLAEEVRRGSSGQARGIQKKRARGKQGGLEEFKGGMRKAKKRHSKMTEGEEFLQLTPQRNMI